MYILSILHHKIKEKKKIKLTPRQESSRVFRLSLRLVELNPKDVQEVDHREESLPEVSPDVRDIAVSRFRLDDIVTSLKQGLSKA